MRIISAAIAAATLTSGCVLERVPPSADAQRRRAAQKACEAEMPKESFKSAAAYEHWRYRCLAEHGWDGGP